MIGDAAARALDAAVLRDFELALAEYDESGTDWRDVDARSTADATAANGPANAAPDAEPAAAPAPASAHARPSVEWGVIDPPHAGLASLLERHDRHRERPEPAPAPRTKAPVAVR
jgi:hypothetical protein